MRFQGNKLECPTGEARRQLCSATSPINEKRCQLSSRESDAPKSLRLCPNQSKLPGSVGNLSGSLHPHGLAEQSASNNLTRLQDWGHWTRHPQPSASAGGIERPVGQECILPQWSVFVYPPLDILYGKMQRDQAPKAPRFDKG